MLFYKKYYVPANITIGIAGDVDPKECRRMAEKYFSILPAGALPSGPRTVEPPQKGERRLQVESPAQPFMAIAYKRPDQTSPDDPVFDVLNEILSGERTGLLYKELVRDQKIALAASTQASFPGGKYPNLFLFFLVPNMGHTVEENEKASYKIIERVKTDKVDEGTLNRIKTKVRADLIHRLTAILEWPRRSPPTTSATATGANVHRDRRDRQSHRRRCAARSQTISDSRSAHRFLDCAAGRRREGGEMKSLTVLTLLLAPLALAQTEVHRGPVNLPSYKQLKFPPLPPLEIPKPVEFTLSNGIRVFLLEDHELPLVSGAALVRTGNLFDPAG